MKPVTFSQYAKLRKLKSLVGESRYRQPMRGDDRVTLMDYVRHWWSQLHR